MKDWSSLSCFVAALAVGFAFGNGTSEPRSAPSRPAVDDIINLAGKVDLKKKDFAPIYKVPEGRALIVTYVRTRNRVDVVQRKDAKDTVKLNAAAMVHANWTTAFADAGAGLAFRSKSLVGIGYNSEMSNRGAVEYVVTGYLVDE